MTDFALPPLEGYQPLTFRERGLAVGFTTPLLASARVRAGRKSRMVELVVPNPSGGRGVYVMEWEGVRELCAPTLHDMRLGTALAAHHRLDGELTPVEIRRVTRIVLSEGYAGRAAALAAAAAMAGSERLVAETHRALLDRLAGGRDPRVAMAEVALESGRDVDAVAAALARLARVVAELGIDHGAVPRGLAELGELAGTLGQVAAASAAPAGIGGFIAAHAELTATLARRAVEAARGRLGDLAAALREWIARPAALREAALRPEWLLDGWPRICLLGRTLETSADPADVLAEMVASVPPIPPQVEDWLDLPAGTATRANPPRSSGHGSAACRTSGTDQVARNERLLAQAA